jgi:hypothetical protein
MQGQEENRRNEQARHMETDRNERATTCSGEGGCGDRSADNGGGWRLKPGAVANGRPEAQGDGKLGAVVVRLPTIAG